MDFLDLSGVAAVAASVGVIIQGVKTIPGFGELLDTKAGKLVLHFLPFLLGVGFAFMAKAFGAGIKDPISSGLLAAAFSGKVYDLLHERAKAKQGTAKD